MTFNSSELFPPTYNTAFQSAIDNTHEEYWFVGGRGSIKSTFISYCIKVLLLQNKNIHAIVLRKNANGLRGSVLAQMQWTDAKLGLNCNTSLSPMQQEINGQRIIFSGCDNPAKIKSIKVPTGYIAIVWFEELTEFTPEEMRSVLQSVARGGEKFWVFVSFNPPVNRNSWCNKEAQNNLNGRRFIHRSTYLDINPAWLGQKFINDAEWLKVHNYRLYANEYLGECTGSGLDVFENITQREITDEEINNFEWIYRGIDWGYYPDPFVYCEASYNASTKKLYIYKGFSLLKSSNINTETKLNEYGVSKEHLITCDNDRKDIDDFRIWGWNMRPAEKGPGSVEAGFKWLQSLTEIIIDPVRVPEAVTEFSEYEYERDRNGNVLSGYPQGQADHYMAATRYMMEQVWKRRGM